MAENINFYILDKYAENDAKGDVFEEFLWSRPDKIYRQRRIKKLSAEESVPYLQLYEKFYGLYADQMTERSERWI